ncbi:hypothetical protein [Natrinema salinisoli]|uniref:hypothetical protein n=1 Tax=Natrinema salinisoli TaxID=2878535 RepID=UPI001CF00345|nr:hypothetical protein [Natrinema salinisoli]
MSSTTTLLGTFVAVFVLIVGAVSVGGLVVHDGTPEPAEVDTDHWDSETIVPEQAPDGGEIEMDSTESGKTIVVNAGSSSTSSFGMGPSLPIRDDGPNHRLSVGSLGGVDRDVNPLVSALVENGHEVVFYDGGPTSNVKLSQTLEDADAFLTVGSATYTPTERNTLEQFIDSGGRTLIVSNPGSTGDTAQIASAGGVYTHSGYLYNLEENDNNHLGVYAEPTGDSSLTEGIDRVVLRGATPVGASSGETALETSNGTTLSTTREAGTYGVAARNDNVAVIGDESFLTPENVYRVDNNVLAGNLADFLVTGEEPNTDFGNGSGVGGPNQPPMTQPPQSGQTSGSS